MAATSLEQLDKCDFNQNIAGTTSDGSGSGSGSGS